MEKLNEKEEKKSKGIFEKLKNKKVTWEDIQKAFNIMDHLGEAANKLGIMLRMIQADFKGEFQIPINDKIQIGAAILYAVMTLDGIPDILPVIGFTDDITIISFVFYKITTLVDEYQKFELEKTEKEKKALDETEVKILEEGKDKTENK